MDGTKVGILEQSYQVSLTGLLESKNSSGLKAKIGLEVLGDLTDETLEWGLANEKVGRFLVLSDFAEGNSSGTVTVGLLDSSGSWCGLASSLIRVGIVTPDETLMLTLMHRQIHRHRQTYFQSFSACESLKKQMQLQLCD
jgi:hypothetical protein